MCVLTISNTVDACALYRLALYGEQSSADAEP